MKQWFSIQARAGKASISVYDEIGAGGVTAAAFADQLKAIGAMSAIDLSINSPGGDVFASLAIYNMLRRHPAKVTVTVDGVAASGGSLIAMAGDVIVMPSNSFLMLHNPAGAVMGDAVDMRGLAEALDKMAGSMAGIYAARSGQTVEKVKAMMQTETWLTATEAVEMGFADKVEQPVQMAASFDLKARYPNAPVSPQAPMSAAEAAAYETALIGRWTAWLQSHPGASQRIVDAMKHGEEHYKAEHTALWNAAQRGEDMPPPIIRGPTLATLDGKAIWSDWNGRPH